MAWILVIVGAAMISIGAFYVISFWLPRVRGRPQVATATRTWSMLVGAFMSTLGLLALILGILWVVRGTTPT
jgi:hypothetical protein